MKENECCFDICLHSRLSFLLLFVFTLLTVLKSAWSGKRDGDLCACNLCVKMINVLPKQNKKISTYILFIAPKIKYIPKEPIKVSLRGVIGLESNCSRRAALARVKESTCPSRFNVFAFKLSIISCSNHINYLVQLYS